MGRIRAEHPRWQANPPNQFTERKMTATRYRMGNARSVDRFRSVKTFPIFFGECSSHFCQVVIHPTLKKLRSAMRGIERRQNIEAATVIHPDPRDSLIATIHLCRERLDCPHICHECLHAAWARSKLLGIKPDDDFQEFTAYGQASLLTQIADWLES